MERPAKAGDIPQTGWTLDGNVPGAPASHRVTLAAIVAFPSPGKSCVSDGVHENCWKNWKVTTCPFKKPPVTPIRALAAGAAGFVVET